MSHVSFLTRNIENTLKVNLYVQYQAMLSVSTLSLLFVILLGVLAAPAAKRHVTRLKTIRKLGCEPPRSIPQKDPIFGLDVALRMFRTYDVGQRSAKFKLQHETHGPTFQSVALGKTRIFTIEPDNLRTMFSTNFAHWGVQPLRLPAWEPFLGRGVMDTDGEFWRHARGMVQPLFKREQIYDLCAFDVHVGRLLELLPADESTVDLQPLFARLILDFTTEFLFGESVECLTLTPKDDALLFLDAFHYGQAQIGKRTQLPYWTIFTRDAKFWDAAEVVRNFVDKQVDRAVDRRGPQFEGKLRRYVLVDKLVQTVADKEDIRNQLLNTFLAAHDTTAVLMTNVFFNLARNPTVYKKLRDEIRQADLTPPSSDKISRLTYLHHVVTETSRLTPVVGQSARIALQDTVLPSGGGKYGKSPVFVRSGTSIQFNFFALHRRPEVFGQDPDIFRPERWENLKVGAWAFLPFIGGPRVCPAQKMALMQVRYTVARIVQRFQALENRDPVLEFVEQYRITTDSKNGCKVALVPA